MVLPLPSSLSCRPIRGSSALTLAEKDGYEAPAPGVGLSDSRVASFYTASHRTRLRCTGVGRRVGMQRSRAKRFGSRMALCISSTATAARSRGQPIALISISGTMAKSMVSLRRASGSLRWPQRKITASRPKKRSRLQSHGRQLKVHSDSLALYFITCRRKRLTSRQSHRAPRAAHLERYAGRAKNSGAGENSKLGNSAETRGQCEGQCA
jgi:hypothetical protein